jgi:hypothetical protein
MRRHCGNGDVIPVDVANLAASRIDPSRCDFTVVEALWFG